MDQLPHRMSIDQSHQGVSRDQLPPYWTSQMSRSTGHRYYHNSVTNQSTYNIEDVFRAPIVTPPPPVAMVRSAPVNFSDVRSINDMAAKFSVTELQMMLGKLAI